MLTATERDELRHWAEDSSGDIPEMVLRLLGEAPATIPDDIADRLIAMQREGRISPTAAEEVAGWVEAAGWRARVAEEHLAELEDDHRDTITRADAAERERDEVQERVVRQAMLLKRLREAAERILDGCHLDEDCYCDADPPCRWHALEAALNLGAYLAQIEPAEEPTNPEPPPPVQWTRFCLTCRWSFPGQDCEAGCPGCGENNWDEIPF